MRQTLCFALVLGGLILVLAACGDRATLPVEAGMGAHPVLPAPHPTLVPTVHIAPAQGWAPEATPVAAAGLAVHAYATGLAHPRWLYVLPNGDVLVAETNAPHPGARTGLKGWIMQRVKQRMGAGVPVTALPAGPINRHWTRNVLASRDGSVLYVTVGSNSNVGEQGMDQEGHRAAILAVEPATGHTRVFASGLRNPVGLGWQPQSGALWTTVNERDELGSDLVPDYLTSVQDGDFYGWLYSYYGQHVDPRVTPPRPDLVATARVPDYALGAHTASLGLVFYAGTLLPAQYWGGAFIGQHGSWNRKPRSGYKVIFVPFVHGQPTGHPVDVLTGFVSAEGNALGRPVGVAVDRTGALLVADDVGNTVWRVTPAGAP